MGFFENLLRKFEFDYCNLCKRDMEVIKKKLYFLPMIVGQTLNSKDVEEYLIKNAIPVNSKKDIPTGHYACGIRINRCSQCGKVVESAELFLPVNDKEITERYYLFEQGTVSKLKDFEKLS